MNPILHGATDSDMAAAVQTRRGDDKSESSGKHNF